VGGRVAVEVWVAGSVTDCSAGAQRLVAAPRGVVGWGGAAGRGGGVAAAPIGGREAKG